MKLSHFFSALVFQTASLFRPAISLHNGIEEGSNTGISHSRRLAENTLSAPKWSPANVQSGFPCIEVSNVTCGDLVNYPNMSMVWDAVKAAETHVQIGLMLEHNLLVCDDCFGYQKGTCQSKNPSCIKGLKQLATTPTGVRRFDRAVAHYGQFGGYGDFNCDMGSLTCGTPVDCFEGPGPRNRIGAWAIVKSMTTIHDFFEKIDRAQDKALPVLEEQSGVIIDQFGAPPPVDFTNIVNTVLTVASGLMGLMGIVDPVWFAVVFTVSQGVVTNLVKSSINIHPENNNLLPIADMIVQYLKSMGQVYSTFNDGLFQRGAYALQNGTAYALEVIMRDGAAMEMSDATNGTIHALTRNIEQMVQEQLIYASWLHNSEFVVPFITFEPKPCADVNLWEGPPREWAKNFWSGKAQPIEDVNITYDNKCYYLLQAKRQLYPASKVCEPSALKGSTNKNFADHYDDLNGLNLSNFIVPAVKWWEKNGRQNDNAYNWHDAIKPENSFFVGAMTPGLLNIPVCDYSNGNLIPGLMCPKIMQFAQDACKVYETRLGINPPGTFNGDHCTVRVHEYNPEFLDVNPTPIEQIWAEVLDAKGRNVANMAKQVVPKGSFKLADTPLPEVLIIAPRPNWKDPIRFWYGSTYWESGDASCNHTEFSWGSSLVMCNFYCGNPNDTYVEEPSKSATAHVSLPTPLETPEVGETTFLFKNTFHATISATTTHAIATTTQSPPSRTWAAGKCRLHVRQHQRNEADQNEHPNFEVELYLYDAKNVYQNSSGQVGLYVGGEVDVTGTGGVMRLGADRYPYKALGVADHPQIRPYPHKHGQPKAREVYGDDVALYFRFDSRVWRGIDDQSANPILPFCKIGRYDDGHRDMDCWYSCH